MGCAGRHRRGGCLLGVPVRVTEFLTAWTPTLIWAGCIGVCGSDAGEDGGIVLPGVGLGRARGVAADQEKILGESATGGYTWSAGIAVRVSREQRVGRDWMLDYAIHGRFTSVQQVVGRDRLARSVGGVDREVRVGGRRYSRVPRDKGWQTADERFDGWRQARCQHRSPAGSISCGRNKINTSFRAKPSHGWGGVAVEHLGGSQAFVERVGAR